MGIISQANIIIRTKRDISPPMNLYLPSDLAAGGRFTFDLEKQPYGKYLPFNYLYIANKSSSTIELIVNGSFHKKIEAGTIQTFDAEILPAIWSITLINLDTVNAVSKDDVEIIIQKQKTVKTILENIFSKW